VAAFQTSMLWKMIDRPSPECTNSRGLLEEPPHTPDRPAARVSLLPLSESQQFIYTGAASRSVVPLRRLFSENMLGAGVQVGAVRRSGQMSAAARRTRLAPGQAFFFQALGCPPWA
jgi:hypothetical protein